MAAHPLPPFHASRPRSRRLAGRRARARAGPDVSSSAKLSRNAGGTFLHGSAGRARGGGDIDRRYWLVNVGVEDEDDSAPQLGSSRRSRRALQPRAFFGLGAGVRRQPVSGENSALLLAIAAPTLSANAGESEGTTRSDDNPRRSQQRSRDESALGRVLWFVVVRRSTAVSLGPRSRTGSQGRSSVRTSVPRSPVPAGCSGLTREA